MRFFIITYWIVFLCGDNPRRYGGEREAAGYILASRRNGTLYTGVTSDLIQRVWVHKNNVVEGFTKTYSVHHLVYFELHSDMYFAITREKQIKKWIRAWKLRIIEKNNPSWRDLFDELM